MKKLTVLLAALLIAATMTACGGNTSSSSEAGSTASVSSSETASSETSSSEESSSEAAATGDKMSEADYKAKISEIYTNIQTQSAGLATIDPTDIEAATKMIEDVSKVASDGYTEMANLVPPDSFADAHQKIKDGKDAAIEVLDLTGEMLAKAADQNAEGTSSDVAALQAKLAELTPKMQEFDAAIQSIIA